MHLSILVTLRIHPERDRRAMFREKLAPQNGRLVRSRRNRWEGQFVTSMVKIPAR